MRILLFLLQKEFKQILRDKAILRLMFIMPIMQLIILPNAADYEVKNIKLAIVNNDNSEYSRQLVNKITASEYFILTNYSSSYTTALQSIEKDESDLVIEIPTNFEKKLVKENEATLFMAVNAINGVKGGLAAAYAKNIIQNYNNQVRTQWIQFPKLNPQPTIEVTSSNWYNPFMNYKIFMVPGILVLLLTMIGSNLTAGNIVKEKEVGTIEQINVTPIKKYHFILGKLIPFWLLAIIVVTIGFIIARLFYGIVPLGSFVTIYIFSAVYLLAVLGLGLLISTFSATQQQSMLVSFFIMMIFVLMSGLYTSIESMPIWAQWITRLNPVSYFIEVMRMVVLKGSELKDILPQLYTISIFAFVLNGWAIYSYKKRS